MSVSRYQAELVTRTGAFLGECPVWDDELDVLAWVDIYPGVLHCTDTSRGTTTSRALEAVTGCLAPTSLPGWYLCAQVTGLALISTSGALPVLTLNLADGVRPNDGRCDPSGNFWFGTMRHAADRPDGTLYKVSERLELVDVLHDLTISNGIGWDPVRKHMYFIDSALSRVDRMTWNNDTCSPAARASFFQFPAEHGSPDGLAVDAYGNLWVALWGGGAVAGIDPDGKLFAKVDVPTPMVTSCCFGGSDFSTLFITSARGDGGGECANDPLAGAIFAARVAQPGLPTTRWNGREELLGHSPGQGMQHINSAKNKA